MFEWFAATLLTLVSYQLIGVALLLPLELTLSRSRMAFSERIGGIVFLIVTALLTAIVGLGIVILKGALHVAPIISVKSGFGGPLIAAVALALWVDFQFYVTHRLEHRFLWRFHAVHHSIRNLSAANSYHHWTEAIWLPLSTLPLMLIDVRIGPTLGWLSLIFHYQQFYIHSSAKPHLGPLRWLFVDNVYHRVHHSVQPEHHDMNFGAMTPLWDLLFGTFHMPKSSDWPEVGLKELTEPAGLKEWSSLPWRLKNSTLQSAHEGSRVGDLGAIQGLVDHHQAIEAQAGERAS